MEDICRLDIDKLSSDTSEFFMAFFFVKLSGKRKIYYYVSKFLNSSFKNSAEIKAMTNISVVNQRPF